MGWEDYSKYKKIGQGSFGSAWIVKVQISSTACQQLHIGTALHASLPVADVCKNIEHNFISAHSNAPMFLAYGKL